MKNKGIQEKYRSKTACNSVFISIWDYTGRRIAPTRAGVIFHAAASMEFNGSTGEAEVKVSS